MIPIVFFPSILPEADDMADSYFQVARFTGNGSNTAGFISIGVNDEDTVKVLRGTGTDWAEGNIQSLHDQTNTDYQNTSGYDAIAVINITCKNGGGATRHVKIWSGATVNSTSGATLLYEVGGEDTVFFDGLNDTLTVGPLKVQNNHYLTIENVDDSRTGSNDIGLSDYIATAGITNIIVERGA